MTFHLALAEVDDADAIATMMGELLHEIMVLVRGKMFGTGSPFQADAS